MWTLLVMPALAGVIGAVHVGTADGDGIRWESTYSGHGALPLRDGGTVSVAGRRTVLSRQEGRDGLHPPLLADAWQRVDLVDLEYRPDAALGLERRVDCWAPPAFGGSERAWLETLDPHLGFSTYTDGGAELAGEVRRRGGVGWASALGVFAIFVLAVLCLVFARRAIAHQVRREEAEEFIRNEFGHEARGGEGG